MNGPRWGKDFPSGGNDEVSETYESEDEDEGDVFVDATSQSASGLSSLASSRGGSPAPLGTTGGAEGGAEGADAGTHARRRQIHSG